MAQINADGFVDLGSGVTALGHQLLDNLQLLGRRRAFIQLNPCAGSQLDHAVLGEIFHAAANIAAPLVPHGVRLGVHRNKRQLVEPAGNTAFFVHVAHGLAGAHGNA